VTYPKCGVYEGSVTNKAAKKHGCHYLYQTFIVLLTTTANGGQCRHRRHNKTTITNIYLLDVSHEVFDFRIQLGDKGNVTSWTPTGPRPYYSQKRAFSDTKSSMFTCYECSKCEQKPQTLIRFRALTNQRFPNPI
jgi:hypothetical protein